MSDTQTSLKDMIDAVTPKQVKAQVAKLEKGFDERAAYEALNAPANSSIQDKLKGYRKKLTSEAFAALSHAASIDPNFMNTSPSGGNKRFNVYAIDKCRASTSLSVADNQDGWFWPLRSVRLVGVFLLDVVARDGFEVVAGG